MNVYENDWFEIFEFFENYDEGTVLTFLRYFCCL